MFKVVEAAGLLPNYQAISRANHMRHPLFRAAEFLYFLPPGKVAGPSQLTHFYIQLSYKSYFF